MRAATPPLTLGGSLPDRRYGRDIHPPLLTLDKARVDSPAAQDRGLVGRARSFLEARTGSPLHAAFTLCPRDVPHRDTVHNARYEYAADLVFAADEPAGRFGSAVSSGNWRSGSA